MQIGLQAGDKLTKVIVLIASHTRVAPNDFEPVQSSCGTIDPIFICDFNFAGCPNQVLWCKTRLDWRDKQVNVAF